MDERSQRIADRFQRPLLIAAGLTVPVIVLQLLAPPQPWRAITEVLNWAIWLTFLAWLVLMLAVVPAKLRWLRDHPLDVAIVVLTPPLITNVISSLDLLRLLRLVPLLRLGPLVRALISAAGLRYAALLTLLTAVAGGIAFASAENMSIGNGFYWAITTMTTVGYGDIAPTNLAGKVIAVIVMLVGIGFTALIIGALAERFTTTNRLEQDQDLELTDDDILNEVKEISARLQRLERALLQQRSVR
jgi:voltage-gated potassium channel